MDEVEETKDEVEETKEEVAPPRRLVSDLGNYWKLSKNGKHN